MNARYRHRRRTLLIALASAAIGIAAPGCGSSDPGAAGSPATGDAPAATTAEPSPLAERIFSDGELRAFVEIGAELELDWPVLAAAQRTETAGRRVSEGAEGREAISAIAYTLAATGAPTDYETALQTRGGNRYAKRVLRLAERLRGSAGARLPVAEPPFGPPVEGQLVAGFGKRFGTLHDGLDIAAPDGAELAAIAPGLVISTGFDPAYGNRTCIAHRLAGEEPRRISSCYGNQSSFEVETGDRVAAGQLIGRVGCSGPCLRPHVHLQILRGSSPSAPRINPAPFLEVDATDIGTRYSLEAQ